jgi:hypothetical protein
MKLPKNTLIRATQGICVLLIFMAAAFRATAQIDSSDPSLRLWLQASTISSDLLNSGVTNWADSSSFHTIMAPPPLPPADGGTLANRTPQLIMVTNNGIVFQAVQFRQAYDPLSGGAGHYADRLWQTNNLDANDPTLIDPTNDMTLFFVYQNNDPNGALGGSQCIFAKRGPSACPFEFGLNASALQHMFVTYAGQVGYDSTNEIPTPNPEWGLIEMNVTASGTLTFREYYASHGGWETSVIPCARGGENVGDPVTIAFHTQGAGGDSGNPWGNGVSERFAGYIAEAALYNRTLSPSELAAVENSLLSKYFLQSGPPQIKTQPQNQSAFAGNSVNFSVLADGTPPFTYQWLFDGSPINGANSQNYGISSVAGSNAGTYSVIVSNSISFVTSSNAVLTVQTNSLALVSALRDYDDQTTVTVTFSAAVNPNTAANTANYSINNGVTVNDVTLVTNGGNVTTAILTTSPITVAPAVLTVNNVQDQFGNTIAANSQATIPLPTSAGAPPLGNCLLWLAGDQSLFADNIGVYEWDDQSGAANEHDALFASGNSQVAQFAFPNGIHPVVNFPGTAWLQLDNSADFQMTNFTIYVVGDVNNTKQSDDFAGLWTGWGLGINDGLPGVVKWVTYQPDGNNDTESPAGSPPTGAHLGNRVPYLIEGSFVQYGQKSLAINGSVVANESTNGGISYGGSVVTIGALNAGGAQPLYGDIAEMLIYTNVTPSEDAAIRQYIATKYFTPSLNVPALVSAARDPNIQTSVSVVFSQPINPATATNAANYVINPGVSVSSAALVNPTNVVLTTSAIAAGQTYTLTVNGVTDWAGNSIAANSTAQFTVTQSNQHLYIGAQGGQVSVTWSNTSAALEGAGSLLGPWTNITATSPLLITNATGNGFFRLQ